MTSLLAPAPTTKPARTRTIVTLALSINGQGYGIEGTVYDVAQTPDGHAECTCPDYEARRRGLDASGCKHVKAMRQMGLIDPAPVPGEPAPEPTPGPAPEPAPSPAPTPAPVDDVSRLQARAFGIRLPEPAARRPFGVGLVVEPEPEPAACCPPSEAEPCQACLSAPAVPGEPAVEVAVEDDPAAGSIGPDDEFAMPDDDDDAEDLDADAAGLLTLDQYIDAQADRYLALGHGAGRLIADALATLARSVRFYHAMTPDQYLDRSEADGASRWADQGEPDACPHAEAHA